jgi:hypothetical protein
VKTNTIRAETRTGIPARTKCGGDVTKYLVEIRQGDAVAIPPEEILAQSGFESPNRLAKCGEKGIRPQCRGVRGRSDVKKGRFEVAIDPVRGLAGCQTVTKRTEGNCLSSSCISSNAVTSRYTPAQQKHVDNEVILSLRFP